MHLTITHTTRYSYETPVHYALQKIRLIPRDTPQQRINDWKVQITGGNREVIYHDQHGNVTELMQIDPGASEVSITASGRVETRDTAGILGKVYGSIPLWLYLQHSKLTKPGDGIREIAATLEAAQDKLTGLHDMSARIAEAVKYGSGQTYAGTTAEEALKGGKGVCQDHAQIFISAARSAGIPARYVSGYLMMKDRVEQSATHAWAEAHLDTLGWVGFDVSNAQSPDEHYVNVATGRDYLDAAPISGLRQGSGDESMIVSLQVQQ